MLTDLNATPTEPVISKKNFYIDAPNPTIQNDCLGRGQFISAVTVRGDADEVLDGDAEGRDRRGAIHGLLFLLYVSQLAKPWTKHQ